MVTAAVTEGLVPLDTGGGGGFFFAGEVEVDDPADTVLAIFGLIPPGLRIDKFETCSSISLTSLAGEGGFNGVRRDGVCVVSITMQ